MWGASEKRADIDDPPLFGARARPLPPPASAQCLGGPTFEEPSQISGPFQSASVALPTSGDSREAAKACPSCSVSPYMDMLWALLQPLQVCRGSPSLHPDMEVAEDGQVTYEWKAVVERERSVGGSKVMTGWF
mmetsp:Transcript_41280/g.96301  ORF Transcript_41280/g.96301 Transcript_41280/m.96301 type:complete len:133 (+) Transcript_41280:63-461(+)